MKPILDDPKKRNKVLDILRAGCSRHLAAKYIGCDERTIRNYARQHPEFADKLRQSELQLSVDLAKAAIRVAIEKGNSRLLTYLLDRLCPEEFANPKPGSIAPREVKTLMGQVGDEICRFLPDPAMQAQVFQRLESLVDGEAEPPAPEQVVIDATTGK